MSDRSEQRRGRGDHPRRVLHRRDVGSASRGDRRTARGRASRKRGARIRGSIPARVARARRHATARRGPDGSSGRASLARTRVGTPAAPRSTERDPQQMTSRTVAGNGPRARDRSGVRRTARGRCRRRPCRRRCGGRRRAVGGGEARQMGSDTFCTRGLDVGRLERDAMVARGAPRKRARDARASGPRRIETHLGGGDARGDGGVDNSGHFVDGGACDGRWLGA